MVKRKVRRYQRGNQKPYIGEQTTQWPEWEKDIGIANDIQSTTQETNDRATRSSLKTGSKLWYSGVVSSFCSTCCIRPITLITNHSVKIVTRSLVFCACFIYRCLSFGLFLLVIVLSVHLRFKDSDYPFGIFKLFL